MNLIDINDIKRKANKRFIIHISFVSLLSVLIITGSVLLLVYSKLDYVLNLVIDIVMCSLLAVFLIFYFINVFPLVLHYYKFAKGLSKVSLDHHRSLKFIKEKESKDIDKVNHRVVQFAYLEGEKEYLEDLYVLDSDVTFSEGKHYKLDTFQSVIVSYEVL